MNEANAAEEKRRQTSGAPSCPQQRGKRNEMKSNQMKGAESNHLMDEMKWGPPKTN